MLSERWMADGDHRFGPGYRGIPCATGEGYLMPRGPRGEKRPADVIGTAVKTMRILTGEETEELDPPPTPGQQLGKLGGAARARKLTPEKRKEIAKKAADKRWGRTSHQSS